MEKRLSFNQASNKLREMKDNLASGKFKDDILARIKDETSISVSSSNDRKSWLLNSIKGLDEATPHGERVFLTITSESSCVYTRKQIGNILKQILKARIHGYTCGQIAKFFKLPTQVIEAMEELGKLELMENLKAKGFIDISRNLN